MRIEKLIIKDFRSHRLTKVSFTSGINLIVGQNGSGKSSLLDALLVGLYWPSKPKDLKKEDILRVDGQSTEITVFFEKDGVSYQLHRNITRGVAFAKYHDGSSWKHATETSQKAVRDWMEKLVPYDVFLNAIYIRQGEIDAILESDESREKVVRQVLGLDKYENAYKNLLEVRKEIERRIKSIEDYLKSTENLDELIGEMEKELSGALREINELSPQIPKLERELERVEKKLGELDELEKSLNSLRLEIKEREGNRKRLETRVEGLEKRIAESEERLHELEEKVREFNELREKAELYLRLSNFRKRYTDEKARNEKLAENYRAQIEAIDERLAELSELEKRLGELEKEKKELERKFRRLEKDAKAYEDVRSISSQLEGLKKRLKLSREEIEDLAKEIEDARKRKEEIQRELEEINEERGGLKNRVKERNRAIMELKKAKGKCPVCGRKLTEKHRKEIIEKYQAELKEVSLSLKELDERERKLRGELVRIEKVLKRERELIAAKELLDQISGLEERLKEYDLEKLRKRAEEYERVKGELNRLEGELESARAELEKVKALEKKRTLTEGKLRSVEEKLRKLDDELREMGFSGMEELDEKLAGLEPTYRRYLELKGAESELQRERKNLERLRTELEGVKMELDEENRALKRLMEALAEKERLYSREEHERTREAFTSLREELAGKRARLEALERKRDETMENLGKLREEKERRREKARELDELRKARERVQELREKVRRYKAMLKEGALARVGDIASEIFEELTEEKYSGVTVKAEENRIRLGVLYNGREYGLGFLSGGERIALGLAFRLALSLYLAGEISLLILDEPTPYLDDERRRRLVDIMQRYLRKIPQVIVVSHDEELKDAADRVIRVSLENGVSVVKEVELGV
ncbi:DNA double-strand break repair ATPase Rad50 [Thermococcus sp. ES12]|uniref:DNA double-strand break repair ATPase Rad50 n=1 Tax=Thermococcus sp. ES12 TaxID=1638246 RepID=UPI00142FF953|nr:DNA double-strand break repair ATPase Rad50 [Thermococcus sp. ES12]NJE76420.1 DNA double-strand break repair ATPase Rad50 [Thermococcus sp. ES12]